MNASHGKAPAENTALHLHKTQREWATWLRTPASASRPDGQHTERLDVYAQLLRNNVSGVIHQCFPVCQKMLAAGQWQSLIEQFFREPGWHHSPVFHDVPKAFVNFLQEGPARSEPAQEELPPWLAALAHYEWLELAVDTAPDIAPLIGPQGLAVNPACMLEGYEWPVHTIGPNSPPPLPATTFVAVFRTAQHKVRFSLLTPASAQLLAILQENGCDWQQAAQQLAAQWNTDPDTISTQIRPLQQQWLADGVLIQPVSARSA